MSILIKGMEMPKERPLIIKISQDGIVYMSQGIYGIGHGIATAVNVPPHGRLIDADRLGFEMMDAANVDQALAMVDDAPTVIEAEEPSGNSGELEG